MQKKHRLKLRSTAVRRLLACQQMTAAGQAIGLKPLEELCQLLAIHDTACPRWITCVIAELNLQGIVMSVGTKTHKM